ncbi:hypothetical protein ACPPVV_17695 [Rhodanobacter sp. Col0626]|uniref:hypothetical protein n=1 Tax=Rhodanobacter sp. Col0626 TaxID=3415679 RepID=UPI003CEB0AF5
MHTSLEPAGPEFEWLGSSAIIEVSSTASGLRIVLAAPVDIDRYVEFHFSDPRAFQAMDEGDMLGFWEPALPGRYALYRVTSGGWRERSVGHYLNVTSTLGNMHEWLVVSSDLCVSVISSDAPNLREFG